MDQIITSTKEAALPPGDQTTGSLEDLTHLETQIRDHWQAAAAALKEIRDRRLYRLRGFRTFEQYGNEYLGFARSTLYKHIAAAEALLDIRAVQPAAEPTISQAAALSSLHQDERQQLAADIDFSQTDTRALTAKVASKRTSSGTVKPSKPSKPFNVREHGMRMLTALAGYLDKGAQMGHGTSLADMVSKFVGEWQKDTSKSAGAMVEVFVQHWHPLGVSNPTATGDKKKPTATGDKKKKTARHMAA